MSKPSITRGADSDCEREAAYALLAAKVVVA